MGLVIKEAKEEPEKSLIPFLHVFLVFFPKERVKAEATSASYFSTVWNHCLVSGTPH